jgi:hypothetical protein
MTNKATSEAAAKLAALEQHKIAAKTANFKMIRAQQLAEQHADDPDEAARFAAKAEQHAAEKAAADKAHAESGVTQRDIDIAAQAVLDARGEGHTETNITAA